MKTRNFKLSVLMLALVVFLNSCGSYDLPCDDSQIESSFIRFQQSDIDTIMLKKYKASDNFQTLLDTVRLVNGYGCTYKTNGDTTSIFINNSEMRIRAGYDWMIYIPAKNRTVLLTEIMSERNTMDCPKKGVFGLDGHCSCFNRVFSLKINGVSFPFQADRSLYQVFITN